jgi:hypothetical protein
VTAVPSGPSLTPLRIITIKNNNWCPQGGELGICLCY